MRNSPCEIQCPARPTINRLTSLNACRCEAISYAGRCSGGEPLLGHLRAFRRRPLQAMSQWWRRHGDALRFRLGPKTLYLLSHPDLAEEILVHQADCFVKVYEPRRPTGLALVLGNGLVTSSGDVWKRHRRIIQPVFHRARMAAMAERMAQVGEQRIAGWTVHAGGPVDIADEMMRLALEVISQTMFHTNVADHIDHISHALRVSLKYAFDSFHSPLRVPVWVPTPRNREFRLALQFMDKLIYGLIAERRRTGAQRDDLLDLLLRARDEETGAGLSDQELRDEALTIFAAGHETTANALAWTWYLLATHPEVKACFHEEVDRVLQGRTPQADDLQQLPYTRAVFDEAVRYILPFLRSSERPPAAQASAGSPCLPGRLSWWAFITCIGIRPSGAIQSDSCRSDGSRANGRLPDAPICRSAQDHGPAWGRISRRWKGPLLLALIGRSYDLQLAQEHVEPEIMVTLRPKHGIRMTIQPRHQPVHFA
jgi:cytochrome P450